MANDDSWTSEDSVLVNFATHSVVRNADLEAQDQRIKAAKDEAEKLRAMFNGMSAIDRVVAKRTKQYAAIDQLVKAVEAL